MTSSALSFKMRLSGETTSTLSFSAMVLLEPVFFAELVHAQNGDDVLQLFVALQNVLHLARDGVVLGADDQRIQDARGGVERVDGGVDADLGERAREHHRAVEVRERRGRRG